MPRLAVIQHTLMKPQLRHKVILKLFRGFILKGIGQDGGEDNGVRHKSGRRQGGTFLKGWTRGLNQTFIHINKHISAINFKPMNTMLI